MDEPLEVWEKIKQLDKHMDDGEKVAKEIKQLDKHIENWNGIYLIRGDRYFTKWVKESARLDHHRGFLEYLQPYLKGLIIDIGANIGTHTTFYARYGKVIAIEANPLAFQCLIRNVPEAMCINAAIGHEPGRVSILQNPDNQGASYTTPGNDIPRITIDSLNLDQCNFIKIDIEGDEIAALEGGRKTIETYKPVMCIESNPDTLIRKGFTPQDLMDCITSLGYIAHPKKVIMDSCVDLLCFHVTNPTGSPE